MKQRIVTFLKKYGPVIWLVTAVLLLTVALSLGAYTNFNKVRRVVSAQNDRILFSSNMLYPEKRGAGEEEYRHRTLIQPSNTTVSFQVSVYNFDIANVEIWNSNTIQYTLHVTLKTHEGVTLEETVWEQFTVSSGNQNTTFTKSEGDSYYHAELPGELSSASVGTDVFTFKAPAEAVNAVDLVIEAIPDENSYRYTDNKKLAAVVSIGDMTASKGWVGKILDDQTGDRTPDGYDGFNYEISGMGQGTVTLVWDSNIVEVSPWFQSEVNGTLSDKGNGQKELTFSVGGTDQPTAYQTQFYKASGWKEDTSWKELSGVISVSFKES